MKRLYVLFAGLAVFLFAFTHMVSAQIPWFVATNGAGDGSSWENATNSIQGAINASSPNDTVLVSNGVYDTGGSKYSSYEMTNRVYIAKAITVSSVNGPAVTFIKGSNGFSSMFGTGAVRCAYMTGGFLTGFTLTNGCTMSNGVATYDRNAGGVFLQSDAIISNCVISGNNSAGAGGGVYVYKEATVDNCIISGNMTISSGGGIYWGAGTNGALNNCIISRNQAHASGGGLYLAAGTQMVNNCIISQNQGGNDRAGGIYMLNSYGVTTLKNCLVIDNVCTGITGGGGVWNQNGGQLINCTIASNRSVLGYKAGLWLHSGGNTLGVTNCIIYNNAGADINYSFGAGLTVSVSYSCTSKTNYSWMAGNGTITNNPQFVDTNSGNYRLVASSPCVNTGTNMDWMTNSYDLDGRTRIRYGIVDMGAYEHVHVGTVYNFR